MGAILERKHHGSAGLAAVAAVALLGLLLVATFAPSAQARVEAFQGLASSPTELTAVTADPGTGLVYAQENSGKAFYHYDPRTNAWTERAEAPIDSGNNGGAAYLNGKIYVVYTSNSTDLSVYDVGSNSWSTIPNPLESGTGNIAAGGGKLYLAVGSDFVSYDPATEITTTLAEPPEFPEGDGGDGFESWGGLQVVEGKIYGHQGNGATGFAVYDIATNSWQELPYVPEVEEEGAVLGSAYNPITNSYLTAGPYEGNTLYRFDLEAGSWSTATLPFDVDDNGMAYLSLPGFEGTYIVQGESGTEFTRYTERNLTDLSPSISAGVAKGGLFTYTVQVRNHGPERASGVVLSDPLPAGATLISAVTPQGTCAAAAVLTCNLGLLRSGTTASVTIQLQSRLRNVTNTVAVSSLALDSNAGNDSATALASQCVVPKLKRRSVKGAKKALRKANCKPGKVKRRYNGKVKKGKVIRGGKARGKLLPAGSKVKLVVSKGPKQA